jgi:hypothetical protein
MWVRVFLATMLRGAAALDSPPTPLSLAAPDAVELSYAAAAARVAADRAVAAPTSSTGGSLTPAEWKHKLETVHVVSMTHLDIGWA